MKHLKEYKQLKTKKMNILREFFSAKAECEWNLLNDAQQEQLIQEFEEWCAKRHVDLLPDEVTNKEEFEQYLKDIGKVKEVKIGMYGEMPEILLGAIGVSLFSNKEDEKTVWLRNNHTGEGTQCSIKKVGEVMRQLFDEVM